MPGLNYAGFQREAIITTPTWPSSAPAVVTRLLRLTGMDVQQGVQKQLHADGHGPVGVSQADVVRITPSFTLSLALTYGGLESIFAAALGLEARRLGATVMPEQLTTGVYRHVFEVDPVMSAMAPWQVPGDGVQAGDISVGQRKVRRGTVAAYREFGVWEWLSCMINEMSLSWEADNGLGTCTLACLAYSTSLASAVNTATTLGRAVPNASPDVLFNQGVIRLGPYSTVTPLSDVHRLACEQVSVSLENRLIVQNGHRTGLYSEEFERGSPPSVSGSLLKPRYTDNTLVDAWSANTRYCMDIKFTGPLIGNTTYRRQLNIYIPGLFFTNVEPSPLSVAKSNLRIEWVAAAPDVAPAGQLQTARISPLVVEVISSQAAHQLLS